MTDLDLDAIEARANAARLLLDQARWPEHTVEQHLEAFATDAHALVAEVRRLRGEDDHLTDLLADVNDEAGRGRAAIARVRALHERYRPPHRDDTDICPECSRFPVDEPYPCATIRALDGDA